MWLLVLAPFLSMCSNTQPREPTTVCPAADGSSSTSRQAPTMDMSTMANGGCMHVCGWLDLGVVVAVFNVCFRRRQPRGQPVLRTTRAERVDILCNDPPPWGWARLPLAALWDPKNIPQKNTCLSCALCPHSCAPRKYFSSIVINPIKPWAGMSHITFHLVQVWNIMNINVEYTYKMSHLYWSSATWHL
jgi:hypothetical protein